MKNRYWILVAIAGLIVPLLISCDHDKGGDNGETTKDCVYKNSGNGHLGIGEKTGDVCGDTGCTGLQDYKKNGFPKSIYRVGAKFDALDGAVDKIVGTYNGIDSVDQNNFKDTVTQVYVAPSAYSTIDNAFVLVADANVAENLKKKAHKKRDHLGIDEPACTLATGCGLQDHRTDAQKTAFPDRPIYRYKALSNYNISDPEEIEKTVDKIIEIFKGEGGLSDNAVAYPRIMGNIDKLCVTKAADGTYTWGGGWDSSWG